LSLGLVETHQRRNCPFLHQTPKKKKLCKGAKNRQWRFLKFLNLLGYGDNEIQIRDKLQQNLCSQVLQFITVRTLGFIPSRLSPMAQQPLV
jgi:hypothetical protein